MGIDTDTLQQEAEQIIIIMMKNFNRRSSHGDHGSKLHELAQRAHSRGSHAFTHTLTSTQFKCSSQTAETKTCRTGPATRNSNWQRKGRRSPQPVVQSASVFHPVCVLGSILAQCYTLSPSADREPGLNCGTCQLLTTHVQGSI